MAKKVFIKLVFGYKELNDMLRKKGIPVSTKNRRSLMNLMRTQAYLGCNIDTINGIMDEIIRDGDDDFEMS